MLDELQNGVTSKSDHSDEDPKMKTITGSETKRISETLSALKGLNVELRRQGFNMVNNVPDIFCSFKILKKNKTFARTWNPCYICEYYS